MTADALDPLIHVPARLQIVATLAALPDGDALSFTRLQAMIGLTPGNLITHLRKLEDAGYLVTEKTGAGPASRTSAALTIQGRAALDAYTETLRGLLTGLSETDVRLSARQKKPALKRRYPGSADDQRAATSDGF